MASRIGEMSDPVILIYVPLVTSNQMIDKGLPTSRRDHYTVAAIPESFTQDTGSCLLTVAEAAPKEGEEADGIKQPQS